MDILGAGLMSILGNKKSPVTDISQSNLSNFYFKADQKNKK